MPFLVERTGKGFFYFRSGLCNEDAQKIKRKVKGEGWSNPAQTDQSLLIVYIGVAAFAVFLTGTSLLLGGAEEGRR
jgi:hypothetical protein